MRGTFSGLETAAKWALLLATYVALDWATFTPQLAPLGITPWNPSIGLAVAAVIAGGLSFAPLLVLAPLATDIFVRDLPFPLWVTGIEALLTGVGYWIGLIVLLRPETKFGRALHSLRDLLLLGVMAAASAAVVAVGYTLVLWWMGYLPGEAMGDSIFRYWVGDVIGLTIVTPFLLLMAFRRDFPGLSAEIVLQLGAILAAVLIVMGLAGGQMLQFSYVLLLPVVWVAVRHGFEGATAALLVLQVCVMSVLHMRGADQSQIPMLQGVLLMLAVSGLAIGRLTSERAQHDRRLRLQQDAIARAARLGSMGEFAASLAHELNQPLTAAGNYARATVSALRGPTPRLDDARTAAEQLIVQVDRSAQVIRRLRELIRVGRMETEPHSVKRLLNESLDLMRPELATMPVAIELLIPPGLPHVNIDLIQIEQVVTNLVRNAVEATVEADTASPTIALSARLTADGFVEISVADNGPGFPLSHAMDKKMAFETTKPDGLGVGLPLCRTIVEAHGGTLRVETRPDGATVQFTLPIVRTTRL